MKMKPINDIWCGPIATEYRAGGITTERGLQAALYCAIRAGLPELSIFVEPSLMYNKSGGPRFRPDLVLCECNTIVLIGEIKFVPNWYPEFALDLEKLKEFDTVGRDTEHKLEIDPTTGTFTDTSHQITGETNYAFFVVGRSESKGIDRKSMQPLLDSSFSQRFSLFYGKVDPPDRAVFRVE